MYSQNEEDNMSTILSKLRETDVKQKVGDLNQEAGRQSMNEFLQSGVKFVASHPKIENVYYQSIHDLMNCIVPSVKGTPMLLEGADFIVCWLESTGTISTELLSRFCPETARVTFELFADYQREDGLIPYKFTDQGPSYRQIQTVTPLARSVWNLYCKTKDKKFLEKMYRAISRNDQWLSVYRDTRGTGCVEAFCTFDVGNDASPRFWHVMDTPYRDDPTQYDPDSPVLPFLAPDLTANIYCQRKYLQLMANELDISDSWDEKAEQSLNSLMTYCYDEQDHFFYDRDRNDQFVRVQSDVLMRVLACEVGDDTLFKDALRRYLLNTKKFFARYPLTVIAIDDPGYDPTRGYNSWAGSTSFLTEVRLPHAFEYHHRYVELSWILNPVVTALSRLEGFAGSLHPWLGNLEYKDNYTPTMLCVLDYLERLCGIYPTPQNELWFTTLIPKGIDYGEVVAEETGYARTVDQAHFELVNEPDSSSVYKDGELMYTMPNGVRLVTDRAGKLKAVIGMSVRTIKGQLHYKDQTIPFSVSGNERIEYTGNGFVSVENPGVVPPCYGPVPNDPASNR
jgi:hypothetical protein